MLPICGCHGVQQSRLPKALDTFLALLVYAIEQQGAQASRLTCSCKGLCMMPHAQNCLVQPCSLIHWRLGEFFLYKRKESSPASPMAVGKLLSPKATTLSAVVWSAPAADSAAPCTAASA